MNWRRPNSTSSLESEVEGFSHQPKEEFVVRCTDQVVASSPLTWISTGILSKKKRATLQLTRKNKSLALRSTPHLAAALVLLWAANPAFGQFTTLPVDPSVTDDPANPGANENPTTQPSTENSDNTNAGSSSHSGTNENTGSSSSGAGTIESPPSNRPASPRDRDRRNRNRVGNGNNPNRGAGPGGARPIDSGSFGSIDQRNTPTMVGTDPSMVPGVKCLLVDERPLGDLVAAAENLYRNVGAISSCKDVADSQQIQMQLDAVLTASKNLKGIPRNADVLASDPDRMRSAQGDVANLLGGIKGIVETINRHQLTSSNCGRQFLGASGVISGLTDIVQAASPIVLSVASANPAFTPALPFLVGLSGAGSVAQVIRDLHRSGTLNMNDDANRQAVLKNICEYNRIVARVDILRSAMRGEVRTATDELDRFSAIQNVIPQLFNADVRNRQDEKSRVRSNLQGLQSYTVRNREDLSEYTLQVQAGGSETAELSCEVGADFLKADTNARKLAVRIRENMERTISFQTESSSAQAALLRVETNQMQVLKQRLDAVAQMPSRSSTDTSVQACSQATKAYLDSLRRITDATLASIDQTLRELQSNKATDPDSASYEAIEEKVAVESGRRKVLSRYGALMHRLNRSGASMDLGSLDRQMRDIKSSLFDVSSGFNSSPALAWLQDSQQTMTHALGLFTSELKKFRREIFRLYTPSGRGENRLVEPLGSRRADPPLRGSNRPPSRQMSLVELNRALFRDLDASQNLTALNFSNLQEGSEIHRRNCQIILDLWNMWHAVLNHLTNQELVCYTISDRILTGPVQPELKRFCFGNAPIHDPKDSTSVINKTRRELAKTPRLDAVMLDEAFRDLRCDQFKEDLGPGLQRNNPDNPIQ